MVSQKDMLVKIFGIVAGCITVADKWSLSKSSYQKTRVPLDWIKDELNSCGFQFDFVELENGLITIIAKKIILQCLPLCFYLRLRLLSK